MPAASFPGRRNLITAFDTFDRGQTRVGLRGGRGVGLSDFILITMDPVARKSRGLGFARVWNFTPAFELKNGSRHRDDGEKRVSHGN